MSKQLTTNGMYTRDGSVAGASARKAAQMNFDSNGNPAGVYNYNAAGVISATPNATPAINITTGTISGADPAVFSLSFQSSMQQNTGANNIVATSQNGYKPGDLVSYQINDDGTVVGNYSNEQTRAGPDRAGKLRQQRRPEIRRG